MGHSLNHDRVCSTIDTCVSMVAQCGLCLGGQPRVGCGRLVKDILQLLCLDRLRVSCDAG